MSWISNNDEEKPQTLKDSEAFLNRKSGDAAGLTVISRQGRLNGVQVPFRPERGARRAP